MPSRQEPVFALKPGKMRLSDLKNLNTIQIQCHLSQKKSSICNIQVFHLQGVFHF